MIPFMIVSILSLVLSLSLRFRGWLFEPDGSGERLTSELGSIYFLLLSVLSVLCILVMK